MSELGLEPRWPGSKAQALESPVQQGDLCPLHLGDLDSLYRYFCFSYSKKFVFFSLFSNFKSNATLLLVTFWLWNLVLWTLSVCLLDWVLCAQAPDSSGHAAVGGALSHCVGNMGLREKIRVGHSGPMETCISG